MLSGLVAEYDFKQIVTAPKEDLLGIEQLPTKGIIELDDIAHFIDTVDKNRVIKRGNCKQSSIFIKDKELQSVDELLDDRILNRLLANGDITRSNVICFPIIFSVPSCSRR